MKALLGAKRSVLGCVDGGDAIEIRDHAPTRAGLTVASDCMRISQRDDKLTFLQVLSFANVMGVRPDASIFRTARSVNGSAA